MPLLRRPHDHRRELQARRRTPRPTIAPSRGQGRDAMTPTASSHHPPAGEPCFRRRIAVAPTPPNAPATPLDHAKATPSTATAATNSRPLSSLRRQRPRPAQSPPTPPSHQIPIDTTRPPRVPSWEAFGRRPSAPADRSPRAGIRNPSPLPTFAGPPGFPEADIFCSNQRSKADLRTAVPRGLGCQQVPECDPSVSREIRRSGPMGVESTRRFTDYTGARLLGLH